MVRSNRLLLSAVLGVTAATAHPQSKLASSHDGMPLSDYLSLLEQIAPAARAGAELYLSAYHQRCGRMLTTGELRLAMSKDGGEPALMGMIRASQMQDKKAISALAKGLSCVSRK